jgi:hypothetical protein
MFNYKSLYKTTNIQDVLYSTLYVLTFGRGRQNYLTPPHTPFVILLEKRYYSLLNSQKMGRLRFLKVIFIIKIIIYFLFKTINKCCLASSKAFLLL